MDGSPLRLLEVAPVAITVVIVIWHLRAERRAAAEFAAAEEDARGPHA
jgi:hypothetical protein